MQYSFGIQVKIGDRVGVDDAILVAHLNTQGTFGLDWVVLEPDSCVRKLTRLNAGAFPPFLFANLRNMKYLIHGRDICCNRSHART